MAEETAITEVVAPNPFAPDAFKSFEETPLAAVVEPIKEEVAAVIEEKPVVEVIDEKPKEEPKKEVAAPVVEPLKFVNDDSEKVFNLLMEGKLDEVYSVLSEQKKLKEVDKLPAADIIKLNLQYQHKDFTPKEINELFEDTYSLPEKPKQAISEDDDEYNERLAKYEKSVERLELRIARDAKPAMTELQKLQKEIVLPDINKPQTATTEPTQEELEARNKQFESFVQGVDKGLTDFNGYKTTFKDEEVEIEVAYTPTKEEKDSLKPLLIMAETDAGSLFKEIGWIDDKGSMNTSKIMEDLPFILNKEKMLQKFVSETGNKRHAADIKAQKNIDYSGSRTNGGDLGKNPQQIEGDFVKHFFQN